MHVVTKKRLHSTFYWLFNFTRDKWVWTGFFASSDCRNGKPVWTSFRVSESTSYDLNSWFNVSNVRIPNEVFKLVIWSLMKSKLCRKFDSDVIENLCENRKGCLLDIKIAKSIITRYYRTDLTSSILLYDVCSAFYKISMLFVVLFGTIVHNSRFYLLWDFSPDQILARRVLVFWVNFITLDFSVS